MPRNLVPLIGISFVVAVVSTGAFYGLTVGKLKGNNATALTPSQIVVAARRVEPGTVLKPDLLRAVPANGLSAGAYASVDELVGATVVGTVHEGQPVLKTSIAARGATGGAALAVPEGMRAVSVRVTESLGVVSMLQTGQRVDVQVLTRRGEGMTLRTALENMEVLSTSPAGGSQQTVVTMLASPRDAELLSLSDATAQVRVVLRNPRDKSRVFEPAAPARPRPPVVRAAANAGACAPVPTSLSGIPVARE